MINREPGIGNLNLRSGEDISRRLEEFGVSVLGLAQKLPKNAIGRHVALQWSRSATGAGSNYEEARGAESRADFIHKMAIASKEIREARYWTPRSVRPYGAQLGK